MDKGPHQVTQHLHQGQLLTLTQWINDRMKREGTGIQTPNLRVPASAECSRSIYFQNKKLEAINPPHLFILACLTHSRPSSEGFALPTSLVFQTLWISLGTTGLHTVYFNTLFSVIKYSTEITRSKKQ